MDVDRRVVAAQPQLGDQSLRLAERIGADQHAARRIGVQRLEQPVDLGAGIGMAEHRQAERRLGDEHVARHRLERRAGRVGAALIVARHDNALAPVLQHDLRRAQDMAGGHEPRGDVAQPHGLAIADRLAVLVAIARRHDRQRVGRRQDGAMPAAGVIGMAVRDQRAWLGLGRIDPSIRGGNVDALATGIDPGTETRHDVDMGRAAALRKAGGRRYACRSWRSCSTNRSSTAPPSRYDSAWRCPPARTPRPPARGRRAGAPPPTRRSRVGA